MCPWFKTKHTLGMRVEAEKAMLDPLSGTKSFVRGFESIFQAEQRSALNLTVTMALAVCTECSGLIQDRADAWHHGDSDSGLTLVTCADFADDSDLRRTVLEFQDQARA